MANTDHAVYTGQTAGKLGTDLHADGSVLVATMPVCLAEFAFTLDGTETTAHDFRLFVATEDIILIPELCNYGTDSTADTDAAGQIEKVNTAGTVTALTQALDIDTLLAQSNPFLRLLALGRPTVDKTDYIQFTLTGDTVISAAEVLWIQIAYARINHN